MDHKELITLAKMHSGQSGKVVEIQGGLGMIERLNAIGITVGKKLFKLSAMFPRGPVTVEVDRAQVAIGFNMANRILLELNEKQ